MASGRKLTLRSSDGETFEVDEAVAIVCQTIKLMVEGDCADGVIPLPNVSSVTLSKVLEYCEKHAVSDFPEDQTTSADEKLRQWDTEFVKVDQSILYHLLMAANFLNIQSLVHLSCQRVADMMKGKTPDEIRKTFNIVNDFSPEEKEQISKEYQWAFERSREEAEQDTSMPRESSNAADERDKLVVKLLDEAK